MVIRNRRNLVLGQRLGGAVMVIADTQTAHQKQPRAMKVATPILLPPDAKNQLIGKDPDVRKV